MRSVRTLCGLVVLLAAGYGADAQEPWTPSEEVVKEAETKAARNILFALKDAESGDDMGTDSVGTLATIFADNNVAVTATYSAIGVAKLTIDQAAFDQDGATTVEELKAVAASKVASLKAAVASAGAARRPARAL